MTTITLDSLISPTSQQVSTELHGETVILHLERGEYFSLNEQGGFLWKQLATPQTARALCAALLATYDVAAPQGEADTLALLTELESVGLIAVS